MSSRTTMPQRLLLHSRPPRKSNSKRKLLSQVARPTSQPARKCSRSKRVKRRHSRRSRPLPRLRKKSRRGKKLRRRRRLKSHIRSFNRSTVASMVPRTLAMTIVSWTPTSRRTFTPPMSQSYKSILKNKRRIGSCSKNTETTCSLRRSRRIEVTVIECFTMGYTFASLDHLTKRFPKNLANSSIYLRRS